MNLFRSPGRASRLALGAAICAIVSLSIGVFAADLSPVSDFGPSEPGFGGTPNGQTARVSQAGSAHRMTGVQAGPNNLLANQAGVANVAAMAQAGNDNWMALSQSGSSNQFSGYQAGAGNRSVIVQS